MFVSLALLLNRGEPVPSITGRRFDRKGESEVVAIPNLVNILFKIVVFQESAPIVCSYNVRGMFVLCSY